MVVPVGGQRVVQEASSEELVVGPAVEAHSLVDLACVEVLVPWGQLEVAYGCWP